MITYASGNYEIEFREKVLLTHLTEKEAKQVFKIMNKNFLGISRIQLLTEDGKKIY